MKNHRAYRSLQPDKIVATIELLERRIGERFPGSGLRTVANKLLQISQEAAARAQSIREPNVPLRIVIVTLIAAIAGLLWAFVRHLRVGNEIFELEHFAQSVDSSLASVVFIGAAIVFLFSLELRIKRHRLMRAIHELRSLAHIVDMHQLTKDPERVTGRGSSTASSPKRTMTPFELGRYLDYCSELHSLVSKVGAIYVQDFPDAVALEAVDQLADLTNGLTRNVWQKIMILENMIGPADVQTDETSDSTVRATRTGTPNE